MTIEPDRTLYRIVVDDQVVPVSRVEGRKNLKAGDEVSLVVPESFIYLLEN